MDTQKIFRPEKKIVIISDYREKNVIDNLKKMDVIVNEMNLEVGDFVCSNRIVIERKTHSDFVSSIIDKRIFDQTKNLSENFEKAIVIIEGSSNREINENALKATIAKLLIDGISIVSTKNPHDTAKTIYWIAKKEHQNNYDISFKVGKKSKDLRRLQEEIVSSLPGVSRVLSKRLLENFGTIEKIFSADENSLLKIKGVGRNLARKIKRLLNGKYQVLD